MGTLFYPSLTQVSAWLGCAASRFLIEISAECLAKQIDDDSEGCISALLETRNAKITKDRIFFIYTDWFWPLWYLCLWNVLRDERYVNCKILFIGNQKWFPGKGGGWKSWTALNKYTLACINVKLYSSVSTKHAPYLDWVVAHLGSCFPHTLIKRVLSLGLKVCIFVIYSWLMFLFC